MNPKENFLEEQEFEEELYDIMLSLVSHKYFEPFLKRLFLLKAGQIHELEPLCYDLEKIRQRLAALRAKTAFDPIDVAWLDYPQSPFGEGFVLIIFYSGFPYWCKAVNYNKQYFMEKQANS